MSAAHCHRAVGFLIPFLLRPVLVTLFLDRTKHNCEGHIQEDEDRSAMKLISLSFPAYLQPFVHCQVQVIRLYTSGNGMHTAASCLSQNLLRAHGTKTRNKTKERGEVEGNSKTVEMEPSRSCVQSRHCVLLFACHWKLESKPGKKNKKTNMMSSYRHKWCLVS